MSVFEKYEPSSKVPSESPISDVITATFDGETYLLRIMKVSADLSAVVLFRKENEISSDLGYRSKYFFVPKEFIFDQFAVASVWKITPKTVPLTTYLKKQYDDICPITVFLHMAEQMSEALHELHSKGIVHRNISKFSFWIDEHSNRIYIFDFLLASNWKERNQNIIQEGESFGSPQYMSPEHTGKLDRPIDYRSDIYSLGILWFEMLTGHLPFEGITQKMAILFAQVATKIPPLHLLNHVKQEIPYIISRIISKMTTKNADERYQSAFGLLYDIKQAHKFLHVKTDIKEKIEPLWHVLEIKHQKSMDKKLKKALTLSDLKNIDQNDQNHLVNESYKEISNDLQMKTLKIVQAEQTSIVESDHLTRSFELGTQDCFFHH